MMKSAALCRCPPRRRRLAALCGVLAVWLTAGGAGFTEQVEDFLSAWLDPRQPLRTWSADFIQTRTLKGLAEPLRTPGRLWFAAPDRFRWELGAPPQTIAVRRAGELLVLYPRLKRAERYPLSAAGGEPWRDALSLLDAGFPSSRSELEARFRLASLTGTNDLVTLTLEPRSPGVRRFLREIRLTLRRPERMMVAQEVHLGDGAVLRNDFTNVVANGTVDPALFEPDLPADFTVVEPFKP